MCEPIERIHVQDSDIHYLRKGMVFWLDAEQFLSDKTIGIPLKRRCWVVVSQDCISSNNVSICPIYTRNEITSDTQVIFRNIDRYSVVVTEDIISISRFKLKAQNFAYILNDDVMQKVDNAICSHLGLNIIGSITDNKHIERTIDNVGDTICNQVNHRFNEISAVVERLAETVDRLTTTESNKSLDNIDTENINILTENDTYIPDYITDNDNIINETSDVPRTEKSNKKLNKTKAKSKTAKKSNKPKRQQRGGVKMPLDVCMDFYTDSFVLKPDELAEKYKKYKILNDKRAISKKRWSIRDRLKKSGIAV